MENSGFKQRIAKWISLRLIFAILLFILSLFVFVTIADEIVLEHESGFDNSISNAILSLQSPLATKIFVAFTFFGSSTFLLPAYLLLVIIFLFKKNWKRALDVTSIGITSTLLLYFLKDVFKRQRPLDPLIRHVTGFSFPSGHSFSSFTFCGMIVYLVWLSGIHKAWKVIVIIALFLFATTIAFSRVYLRVHYPSDVIAGFCLSMVWLVISIWVLHFTDKKFFKQTVESNNIK